MVTFDILKQNEATFWQWLASNGERVKAEFPVNAESISHELDHQFITSFPRLVWEVIPGLGDWAFCICADGQIDLVQSVQVAVKMAPTIPGWIIKAFRQRQSLDGRINFGNDSLGYENVWCSVQRQEIGVDVILFIEGLNEVNDETLAGAAVILMDNAIGEFDAMTKIKHLDRQLLPHNRIRTESFFPLSELPCFLDSLYAKD